MRNIIALQRGLILVPAAGADSTPVAAALQAELMQLGFALDPSAFAAARRAPRDWLAAYHDEVVSHLRGRLGADRGYRPFYANFPAQVMEADDLELFLNAFVHYASNGRWEPSQELVRRGIRFEDTDFKMLRPGSEDDLKAVFTRLVSLDQSLTEDDKRAVAWFVDAYGEDLALPAVIPFKETLCLLAAKGLDVPVRTPTDVLRIAVHLSGGDLSLPGVPKPVAKEARPGPLQGFLDNLRAARHEAREKFKFRKFRRRERRYLLGLLEKTGADAPEMQRHLGRWLRLGEVLHPGEFGAKFPRAAEAFRLLRNQHDRASRVRTFGGDVDRAFQRDWRGGVDFLATRPGEFARRLDWMLRTFDPGYVLAAFARVGPEVSPKVLFELYSHFESRAAEGSPRAVMLKGRGAKMKTLSPLPPLAGGVVRTVGETIRGILAAGFARLPPLGRVWIDGRLRRVPVPFGMRSVNTAVRTYVRGTRVPFRADAKVVRPFLHWHDEDGTQDLDLSAGFYDEAFRQVSHVSFTNLRDARLNCCHSGDIRHRRGPCAEYVDVDIRQCLAAGVRYVVLHAFNYNARPMHTVPGCVFGLMEREHARANEAFYPKTISDCAALANEGTGVIVCIVDLKDADYIWADVEADRALPTLENAADRTVEVLRALVRGTKLSVYELLEMHARARGTPVDDAASADVVLRWEDFVTDYAKVGAYMNY